jgi:zinc D-Ala-D-Ala dipeptidase
MKWAFVLGFLFFTNFEIYADKDKTTLYASIHEVPIKENGEELIDLRNQSNIAYCSKLLLKNPACTQMRKTVYEKLCIAQELLPKGWRFEVAVGLRSLQIQKTLFNRMYEQVRKKNPSWTEKELFIETSKFVAPVKTWEGVLNIPPHSTGGALDLVIIDQQGRYIDMGVDIEWTNINNPINKELIQTDSPLISAEARQNRYIMGKVLSAVGFVNYPAEFWHWSYGDRRWAFVNNEKHSIYGPINEGL